MIFSKTNSSLFNSFKKLEHSLKIPILFFLFNLCHYVALSQSSKGSFVQQGDKYFVNDSTILDQGQTMKVSGDGKTLLVGTYRNGANIYNRNFNRWIWQSKLIASDDYQSSYIGSALAISYDGNTVLMGKQNVNDGIGAAWIFKRKDNIWKTEGQKLVGTGNSGNSNQGFSVALSSDGNTAIIGGPRDNSSTGAIWIFINKDDTWVQQGDKIPCPEPNLSSEFGYSVSVSKSGNTAIIGSTNYSSDRGAI